ncbi:MAG: protein-L-isoaspartate O-methyltransferase, partial [Nitrososphaerales archaeon]
MSSDNLSGYLQQSKRSLLESLKHEGILKSPEIEEALTFVPREAFLDQGSISLAYLDEPLPIASTGQTISAPHMVVMMLEELELQPGMKVLEIGAGSGYNAALLGHIVSRGLSQISNEPLVTSVEREEKLA